MNKGKTIFSQIMSLQAFSAPKISKRDSSDFIGII